MGGREGGREGQRGRERGRDGGREERKKGDGWNRKREKEGED